MFLQSLFAFSSDDIFMKQKFFLDYGWSRRNVTWSMKISNHDVFENKSRLNSAAKKLSWTLFARFLSQTFFKIVQYNFLFKPQIFHTTHHYLTTSEIFTMIRSKCTFTPLAIHLKSSQIALPKLNSSFHFIAVFVANTFIGFFSLVKVAWSWICSLFCLWYFPLVDLWSCKKKSRWISHKSLDSSAEVVTEEQK